MKKYTIYNHIGCLSAPDNGWTKELNLVSWDDREPVYDIRTWNADHTKYGRGVTLTNRQAAVLRQLLNDLEGIF